ncbi:cytochrome P450 51 [Tricladium varicosporioides]|nr:cytochrome P450 51 [Hymenoscyphus varicosporioides]
MITFLSLTAYTALFLLVVIILNILKQLLFPNKSHPPLVFHLFPILGSTIPYGLNPPLFLQRCRAKHGDIFTFILLGRPVTVYLGIEGNDFILNGKLADVNAEEVYGPLTTPVFGNDVVYDCSNAKLMEQKRFVKVGLTQRALESYVRLVEEEVMGYIDTSKRFLGNKKEKSGTIDISGAMAEITIFTAARALQGDEVRAKLSAEFAVLYHDLDKGFTPINFMFPWVPFPHNRKRDHARETMEKVYTDIIFARRKQRLEGLKKEGTDMIWSLMDAVYKDGTLIPDNEIVGIMITLLMAGQHTSSASSSWIMLRLASQPDIAEELYQEQVRVLGRDENGVIRSMEYEDLTKLSLLQNVVKETLRLNGSIHSIMRRVKNSLPIPGTPYIIPPTHNLLASPSITAFDARYFPDPESWNPHRWDSRVEDEDEDGDMIDYGYGVTSKGTRSPYLPFGAGRHRCIGEKFAYLNLGVIVSTLVRTFKFENIEGRKGVPGTDYSSLFSKPLMPATIRWTRREPKA